MFDYAKIGSACKIKAASLHTISWEETTNLCIIQMSQVTCFSLGSWKNQTNIPFPATVSSGKHVPLEPDQLPLIPFIVSYPRRQREKGFSGLRRASTFRFQREKTHCLLLRSGPWSSISALLANKIIQIDQPAGYSSPCSAESPWGYRWCSVRSATRL